MVYKQFIKSKTTRLNFQLDINVLKKISLKSLQ